jgi:hypothetical protein
MRKRQEDKELFEKNLNDTKKKYGEAINFLRDRDEKLLEVNVDGSLESSLKGVLDAIGSNKPDWLRIQYPLPIKTPTSVFEPSDCKISKIVENLANKYEKIPILIPNQIQIVIDTMKSDINLFISKLPFNDLATLFLDIVERSGYKIIGELPWTDLDAFELQYKTPLGIKLKGTAVILSEGEKYDTILNKILSIAKKTKIIKKMSDFMLIFDSSPLEFNKQFYERDMIKLNDEHTISPSTRMVGKRDISEFIFKQLFTRFSDSHLFSITNNPIVRKEFINRINKFGFSI